MKKQIVLKFNNREKLLESFYNRYKGKYLFIETPYYNPENIVIDIKGYEMLEFPPWLHKTLSCKFKNQNVGFEITNESIESFKKIAYKGNCIRLDVVDAMHFVDLENEQVLAFSVDGLHHEATQMRIYENSNDPSYLFSESYIWVEWLDMIYICE